MQFINFRPSEMDVKRLEHCKNLIIENSEIKKISTSQIMKLALEHYADYLTEKYDVEFID